CGAGRGGTGSGAGPGGDRAPEGRGAVGPAARGAASTRAGPVREAGHILAAATAARQTFRAFSTRGRPPGPSGPGPARGAAAPRRAQRTARHGPLRSRTRRPGRDRSPAPVDEYGTGTPHPLAAATTASGPGRAV